MTNNRAWLTCEAHEERQDICVFKTSDGVEWFTASERDHVDTFLAVHAPCPGSGMLLRFSNRDGAPPGALVDYDLRFDRDPRVIPAWSKDVPKTDGLWFWRRARGEAAVLFRVTAPRGEFNGLALSVQTAGRREHEPLDLKYSAHFGWEWFSEPVREPPE